MRGQCGCGFVCLIRKWPFELEKRPFGGIKGGAHVGTPVRFGCVPDLLGLLFVVASADVAVWHSENLGRKAVILSM